MLKKFARGFNYAGNGIIFAFKKELNLKFHFLATLIIVLFIFIFKVSLTDSIIVLILFALVITAELFNTCIEGICNILRDKYKLPYDGSKEIRDMAAGAVLVNAFVAAVIGILVLGKYL